MLDRLLDAHETIIEKVRDGDRQRPRRARTWAPTTCSWATSSAATRCRSGSSPSTSSTSRWPRRRADHRGIVGGRPTRRNRHDHGRLGHRGQGRRRLRRRQRDQPLLRDPRHAAARSSCSTAGSARARCSGRCCRRSPPSHQVIAADLQGHGRTADIDRPIDVRPDGRRHRRAHRAPRARAGRTSSATRSVAASRSRPRSSTRSSSGRLVMVSTNIRRSAIYPEMLAQQGQVGPAAAEFMKDTPMYQLVPAGRAAAGGLPAAARTRWASRWPRTSTSATRSAGCKVPTLFVCADADMFPPSHAVEVFELLDGGQRDGGWMGEGRPAGGHALAILPGVRRTTTSSPRRCWRRRCSSFLDAPEA